MLLLLIPIIWFALAALVVLLCRMAARSDAALARDQRPVPLPTLTLAPRARLHERPYLTGSRAALAWTPRGRAPRTRQGRCVTGS